MVGSKDREALSYTREDGSWTLEETISGASRGSGPISLNASHALEDEGALDPGRVDRARHRLGAPTSTGASDPARGWLPKRF